ncbi:MULTISPECIES: hypothetical protein [unclassified Rummeliibacillus]|uniref:hypothetical protein n=1 Tax=unclassified Rummeliibacillus TaxID=2622809 RepID=UPI00131467E2|nr:MULTISPECIES: hypothetical protein [unclassified Rummeliibacillus]
MVGSLRQWFADIVCYDIVYITHKLWDRGGDALTVFESLMFAIAFATLVITILSFNHKK